jgi:hypothetical protein
MIFEIGGGRPDHPHKVKPFMLIKMTVFRG